MVLISTSCMSPSWSLDVIFYRRFSLANTVGNLHAKKNVLNRKSNLKKNDVYCNIGQNDSFVLSTKSDNGFD